MTRYELIIGLPVHVVLSMDYKIWFYFHIFIIQEQTNFYSDFYVKFKLAGIAYLFTILVRYDTGDLLQSQWWEIRLMEAKGEN